MRDMGIKAQCKELIEKEVDCVFKNTESLESYLRVCTIFYRYDYRNQILIYSQAPDTKGLAGEGEYKQAGGVLKKNSIPVVLLYPKISLLKSKSKIGLADMDIIEGEGINFEYRYDEIPVPLYRIEDAENIKVPAMDFNRDSLCRKIKLITGYNIVFPPGFKGDYGLSYEVDHNERKIKLGKLEGKGADSALICAYVDYEMDASSDMGLKGEYLLAVSMMIKYIVLSFFELPTTRVSMTISTFGRLWSYEDKCKVLSVVNEKTYYLISDLYYYYLRFCDVAFCNNLLCTGDRDIFCNILENARKSLNKDEVYISKAIGEFLEIVFNSKKGEVLKLCELVNKRQLGNFPANKIKMDAPEGFYD